jgi:sporulation protein YlmC with PRC-barrel domain
MEERTQFEIGADVLCLDGTCGQVRCVVVDPVAQEVTHLVVEAAHRQGLGKLVSLDLIEAMSPEVRLNCDLETFEKLDPAEEIQFLPGSVGYATYGPGQALSWPFYGMGSGTVGAMGNGAQAITHDTLPLGEVAVHRGDRVHATDGEIGKVQGLVIEQSNHHVTHVLLQEGHLLGRKEVAIPISAVTGIQEGIRLAMTKQEVQDLPPVDVATNHSS